MLTDVHLANSPTPFRRTLVYQINLIFWLKWLHETVAWADCLVFTKQNASYTRLLEPEGLPLFGACGRILKERRYFRIGLLGVVVESLTGVEIQLRMNEKFINSLFVFSIIFIFIYSQHDRLYWRTQLDDSIFLLTILEVFEVGKLRDAVDILHVYWFARKNTEFVLFSNILRHSLILYALCLYLLLILTLFQHKLYFIVKVSGHSRQVIRDQLNTWIRTSHLHIKRDFIDYLFSLFLTKNIQAVELRVQSAFGTYLILDWTLVYLNNFWYLATILRLCCSVWPVW